jgi:hypothetical protein
MNRRRRGLLAAAFVLLPLIAVGLVLAWPGGDEESGPDGGTTAPTAPQATLPLLGIAGDVPQRAALAVKIENTSRGRPQSGLAEADVVYEEVVEGGLTRLLAVYHSQDPETVGPVRSARSTDLSILAELGRPLFAWSGANPTFAAAVEAADLIDVGYGAATDAYRRADDRQAPYNLYASPEELRAAAGEAGEPPAPLFSHRAEGAPLAGPGVEQIVAFDTSGTGGGLRTDVRWEWDEASGTWRRSQGGTAHVDADGQQVAVPNVLVRVTDYRDTGIRDSVGSVVPEAVTVGEGDAWLLSDGMALPGTWHKASESAPTTFTNEAGQPFLLAPGPTWVEVLPPGAGTIVRPDAQAEDTSPAAGRSGPGT